MPTPNVCPCGSQPQYSGKHIYPCHRGEPYATASGNGSVNSHGTAGALGRLTDDSDQMDPRPIGAYFIPATGSRIFRGRLSGISSPLRKGQEDEFILTAYFDSETASLLNESRFSNLGKSATDGIGYYHMILSLEPPIT